MSARVVRVRVRVVLRLITTIYMMAMMELVRAMVQLIRGAC